MHRLLLTTASLLMLSGVAFAQSSSTARTQTTTGNQATESSSTASGRTATTLSKSGTQMSDSQIEQSLEKQGYSNVKVTGHEQGAIQATASKDGKNQNLKVDPITGEVEP